MKKIFLLPAVLYAGILCAQTTYVAQWQDVSSFTNSSALQYGGQQVIVNTATGDLYTVGNFENSITLGSTVLTSAGSHDIYVAKYNSSGTCLAALKLGSSGFDEGYSLCYRDNYVFVGAQVNGSGKLYKIDNALSSGSVTSKDLGWGVRPRSLYAYGSTGRVLVGGSFETECWLPTATGSIYLLASNWTSCSGCYDSFTGIFNMNMEFTHADNPNNSTASNEIMSIWCRNGRIYCTGYFQGDLKWASSSTQVTAAGVQDAFVASVYISTFINTMSYNADLLRAGSTESSPGGSAALDPGWKECGYGICANGTAIYVTGNLNYGTSPRVFGALNYTGAGAFTARVNYNGSNVGTANWVNTCLDYSSGLPTMRSIGYGVTVDALGNVFSTGRSLGYVTYEGAGADLTDMLANGQVGYISKYDASGNILNVDIVNQNWTINSNTEGRSIVANGCDVYTTGFSQKDNFQAGNLSSETVGTGKCAMYIFEFSRDFTISNHITFCEDCSAFPNVLSLSASGGTSYSWTDPMIPPAHLVNYNSATPTYSLTTCANSGTTNYTCTVTNTVTGCSANAAVSVTAGSSALGVANAGADFDACPDDVVTMGTDMPDGLQYYWEPQTYLGTTWNLDQPTFTCPSGGLPSAITYTVEVTDVCGNVSSDQITVTPDMLCPRRMSNPDSDKKANVFPNPSTGVFMINLEVLDEESNVEFVVTDLAGRVLKQSNITTQGGQVELDLSAQPAGVYLLQVIRNGETEVHQLIIE